MWRQKDVLHGTERFGDRGLVRIDVQRSSGQPMILQRPNQCVVVHQFATRAVDQAGGRLHEPQLACADHPARALGGGGVQADIVGGGQELVQFHEADVQLRSPFRSHQGVIRQQTHLERSCPGGYRGSHSAQPYQTEGFVAQFGAHEVTPLPFARVDARVGLHHFACQAEHQRQGMLRHCDGVGGRSVHHEDAAARRRVEIDIVHAGAGPAHNAQPFTTRQHVRGDLRRAAHDQCVVFSDGGAQCFC